MNPTPSVSLLPLPGGRTAWHLDEHYTFQWSHNGTRYRFTIPRGFTFDGASIPWFLPWGRGRLGLVAPLVHDWLIEVGGEVTVDSYRSVNFVVGWHYLGERRFSRRDADRLFFRILRERGVRPRWLRRWAFRFVRMWSLIRGDFY